MVDFEKIQSIFLFKVWVQFSDKKMHLVRWYNFHFEKSRGGLDVRRISILDMNFLAI